MQASPAPMSARPSTASSIDGLTANSSSPMPMVIKPSVSDLRGPARSASTPAGIWNTRYIASCTVDSTAIVLVVTPNRSAASIDATPRLIRWKIATR